MRANPKLPTPTLSGPQVECALENLETSWCIHGLVKPAKANNSGFIPATNTRDIVKRSKRIWLDKSAPISQGNKPIKIEDDDTP
jgi:hypothetical protein